MENPDLRSPLGPSEELTLRRIALGIAKQGELPQAAVNRLRELHLVDDENQLTAEGRAHYEGLPRPHKAATLSEQKLADLLARTISKNRD